MPLRRFTPSPPGPACGPGPTRHVPIRRTVGAGPAAPRPDSDVSRPPFHATARAPAPVRERGRMDSLPGQAPRARWQLWTCCSSTQQVQACSTGGPDPPGAGCGRGPTTRTASPSPPPGTSSTPSRFDKPLELHEGNPTRRVQRRWGGSTPNHPAALRSGMKMGFDSPEQLHHGVKQVERAQVRVAARAARPGGF